jgi:hypothetical protein
MAQQRQVPCPFCTGQILPKTSGKPMQAIAGFLQRSFNIRIPSALMSLLKQVAPVEKKSLLKTKCEACKGKGTIPDPSDDTSKYQQVKSLAQSKAKEILELENRLAPACGNRYTIIQGNDLLEVGIGMNTSPSYRIDKDKSVRNKGLIDPSKINTEKGGPQFPEGAPCNHVQGLNPMATPGGSYTIKCSNKFTIVTGAQGIDLTTGGPLTISAGITRITGPELTIGTSSGRLTLEGQVVNVNGKSVEIAPSDGHLFVKGTMSATGNVMVGGHMHAESISVTNLECTGKNVMTKPAAPSDLHTGPAFYGGVGVEGIKAAVKDMMGYSVSKATNPVEAQQMISQRHINGLRDKTLNLAYHMRPWEQKATGYILPGTKMLMQGTVPCNYYGPASGPLMVTCTFPIELNNFPHSHALPDLSHCHEVRVPNFDFSADSHAEVRGKQGGVSQGAPLHKDSSNVLGAAMELFAPIATAFVGIWNGIQGKTGPYQK